MRASKLSRAERRAATPGVLVITLLLSSQACVPRDAGYTDVRRVLNERVGLDYQRRSQTGQLSAEAQRLLKAPLNADRVSRLVVLNSPEVQAAVEQVGVARGELVRAAALPNPVAEASLGFSGAQDSPTIELGVMEDLTELFLYSARRGAADAQLRGSALQAAGGVLDLVFRARAQLYRYQFQRRLNEVQKRALGAAFSNYQGAKRLRAAGNITELSLARHQSVYEEARLEAASMEAELFRLRAELGVSLGLWGTAADWKVSEANTELPAGELDMRDALHRVLDSNLRLRGLQAEYEAAARQANYSQARGWIPEFRAGVLAQREEDWEVGPAVELELPIFYQGQGEVSAAEARMRKARAEYAAATVRLRGGLMAAQKRMNTARARVDYLRQTLLPLKRRVVEQAQLQYNAMSLSVFELLAAKREELSAEQTQVMSLRDYWLARNDLEQALAGGSLEHSVAPQMVPSEPTAAGQDGH